mgnify:CR=1 FL=1
MAFLVCENLEYLYSIGTPFQTSALNNVSLEIEKGDLIGIIGHTGSGKSTLIQHLNGLLEPHNGKVILDGGLKRIEKKSGRFVLQSDFAFSIPNIKYLKRMYIKKLHSVQSKWALMMLK